MKYKKVRRVYSKRQKQAKHLSRQAEDNIEKLIFGRFEKLIVVKKFVSLWILLWLLLASITLWQITSLTSYFQTIQPVPGGIYNEGILGTVTNVNPIYATREVDSSLSKLIFAGLFTHNNQNQLVSCLASSYSVDSNETTYTVKLKPHLSWQDGQPLTAKDVVFTIDTIQNPDAQSPLYSSWLGIKVSALNASTIQFKLPNPLASFPYNLTVGIIPQHLLASIPPVDLRSAPFNTFSPVGAGPFAWHAIQVNGNTPQTASEQIALTPFKNYVLGQPKLSEFIVNAYANKNQLTQSFNQGQLTAIAGLDHVPRQLQNLSALQIHSPLLTAGNYVFFKTSSGLLSDVKIRQSLVLAANPAAIIARLSYQTIPVNEPLLIGQLAYNPKYAQVTDNVKQAQAMLSQDGWLKSKNGYLYKNNQQLAFNLIATDTPENKLIGDMLKSQWLAVGAKVSLVFESANTYATTLQDHNYDSTLDGISIGNDPDVYVYWDRSQYQPSSTGLNLSEYDSLDASQALEAGRTRLNPPLRVIKYQPFLADWQKDAPALGLYQPRVMYITRQTVYGLSDHEINASKDRFDNVQNWEILTANVTE